MVANTFIHPISAQSIATARIDWNETNESIMTNFYSLHNPVASSFSIDGDVQTSVPNGAMYRSANTGGLYIKDSARHVSNPVYGSGFTRNGIALTIEPTMVGAVANLDLYELCELFAVSESNNRLYMKTSSVSSTFVDVGIPPTNGSITTAMLGNASVTSAKLATTVANTDGPQTLTGTQTIERAGQVDSLTADLALKATTGDVWLTMNAVAGSTQTSFKHTSSGNGVSIIGTDNTSLANVNCSTLHEGGFPLIPPGIIQMYGAPTAPIGWQLCDGTAISRTTFVKLFNIISTTYGIGDGASTFNVPDLRARFPVGDDGALVLGTQSGTFSGGSITSSSEGDHDHDPSGSVFVSTNTTDVEVLTADGILNEGAHTHTTSIPYVVVNYIIKT